MLDAIKRLFSVKPPAPAKRRHMIETCLDCGVQEGQPHDLFCTKERCPFCGTQLITCGCIGGVLKLSDEEQCVLDEYLDDTVPPLSDIMERWKAALNENGRIPFKAFPDDPFRAAGRGDLAAVQCFLEDGFLPNTGNEVGYRLLMSAARSSQLEVIRLLLSRGADVAIADQNGFTALHCAVMQPVIKEARQVACVRALIDAGADPNVRDANGGTPLMDAAWFGCVESARELLRRRADSTLADNKGRTAKDLAATRGHADIIKLLDEEP
jgi:hypothetical protein